MSNTATVSSQNKRPSHHKRLEFVKPSNSTAQMINDCISLPVQTATGESPLQTSPARTYYTANTADGQQKPSLSPPEDEEEDEEVQHSYSESLESKTQDLAQLNPQQLREYEEQQALIKQEVYTLLQQNPDMSHN